MEFTPWTVATDLGLVSLLILIATIIRAKIKFIQKLFLPAGIIAGIIGLAFGPNGLGILPFSNSISTYPSILIAIIFGALPLLNTSIPWKTIKNRVGRMWAYSQIAMICMWGGGLLFSLILLNVIWDDLHKGFGILLAAGFVGGHGTAAAIGAAFDNHGWNEAMSLAMTSATVGVVAAIVGGLFLIKMSSEAGHTSFITRFEDLPEELRTGLIPKENRKSLGQETVSPISVDPLILNFALVLLIALCGYWVSQWGSNLIDKVTIPAFSVAFVVGMIIQQILQKTGMDSYIDKHVVNRISGSATDLLVAFGVASISLAVVVKYMIPLLLLFGFGLFYCWVIFRYVSPKFFDKYWFERGIFTWGWTTGTMAMGIALLRIVDPELKSKTLDDFAIAYIPIAPVEIAVVTFAPLLIVSGQQWIFILSTLGFGLALLLLARIQGFIGSGEKVSQNSNGV